jgi:hypothetical protein
MEDPALRFCTFMPSGYEFLDNDSIQLLERAIWLGWLGRLDEALAIFDDELADWAVVPVIVVERNIACLRSNELARARMFTARYLEELDEEELDLPENRLIAIQHAYLELSQGRLAGSLRELDRAYEWLKEVPVSEYTDVQV